MPPDEAKHRLPCRTGNRGRVRLFRCPCINKGAEFWTLIWYYQTLLHQGQPVRVDHRRLHLACTASPDVCSGGCGCWTAAGAGARGGSVGYYPHTHTHTHTHTHGNISEVSLHPSSDVKRCGDIQWLAMIAGRNNLKSSSTRLASSAKLRGDCVAAFVVVVAVVEAVR